MENGKTQWNTLASWAGVILIFVGMVGGSVLSSVISNQNRIEDLLTAHLDRYQEYIYKTSNVDGSQNERLDNIEKVVERLRNQTQTNFELLNENFKRETDMNNEQHMQMQREIREDVSEASSMLDTRLQRELNDRVNPLSDRLDMIEKRATERFNWLEERLFEKISKDERNGQ